MNIRVNSGDAVDLKTNIEITYFIRTNLYVQNFMLIQKKLSIFALR